MDDEARSTLADMRRREKKWVEKKIDEKRKSEDAEEIRKLNAELEESRKIKEETREEETLENPRGIYSRAAKAQISGPFL